jgi:hypothetical protein
VPIPAARAASSTLRGVSNAAIASSCLRPNFLRALPSDAACCQLHAATVAIARHTLITELVESGAGDQTIMDIAGHVSRRMLARYSHIRMEAKRRALEAVGTKETLQTNGPSRHRRSATRERDRQKIFGAWAQNRAQWPGLSEDRHFIGSPSYLAARV